MFKAFASAMIASVIGLACGWFAHVSNFAAESEFGPFKSADREIPARIEAVKREIPADQMPKLEVVGGEQFDFGVMEPGAEGKHSFVVRNAGQGPLELEVAGSTCKCTVGSLKDATLEPGEQTEIDLTWITKSSGEEFGQSAILKTNDPTRGELNLVIRGRVISSMTMVPRTFSFGEVESGDTIVLESVIFSFSKTPIVAVKQSFSEPDITARSTFSVEEVSVESTGNQEYKTATQAFKVRIEIAPGLRQGPLRDNFSFGFAPKSAVDADGKYDEDVLFQFYAETSGRIVGAITLVENRRVFNGEGGYYFTMGEVDPKEDTPLRANIILRGPKRNTIKLSIGDVQPKGILRAELGEPVGRSTTVLVPLTLSVDPEAKPIDMMGRGSDDFGTVSIQTDDPTMSPLQLKVRFQVAKP
ncbi:MAG TPA: hypothetical protein DDZ51_03415 [Planctomycetaceae bacterium]|nr:hypothetical protein [Planctomycetaceae bacterium]